MAMAAASASGGDERRRARLAPRPRPSAQRDGAVVVVAPEALALAAVALQERTESEQAANAKLGARVAELELALRRARTDVKRRRELPNNETFTKALVEKNHELVRRNRALEARLAHYQGRGGGTELADVKAHQGGRKSSLRQSQERLGRTIAADQQVQTDAVSGTDEKDEAKEESARAALVAVRPLVDALKKKLQSLETDLARLGQENELLRAELSSNSKPAPASSDQQISTEPKLQIDLCARLQAQTKLLDILDIKYKGLKQKAEQQSHLYQDSLKRQQELSAQLLSTKQELGDCQQRLSLYSDQHALVEDLQNEVHMLRSDNAALNDAVATLSSRPFDTLSKELQKKNLLIAELELEKSKYESVANRAETDARAAFRASDGLRKRIKQKDDEIQSLVAQLDKQRLECERVQMEREVAQLQLRFYIAPPDKKLLVALGNAVRDLKKQEEGCKRLALGNQDGSEGEVPTAEMKSTITRSE